MRTTALRCIQAGAPGLGASVARAALGALSAGWWAGSALSEGLRALGLRRTERLPVPVVSVGNLVAGGTGKTPFVTWLVRGLRARGRRPGVLARGYGPRPPGERLSDEGLVLHHDLGASVPYVEDPVRARGGRALLAAHPETDVLVLDDGFQHRSLARDLDVVLLDATNPFGYGRLLPRGLLRERPRALARAGAVVLTRCERVPAEALPDLERRVAAWTAAPVAHARTRAVGTTTGGEESPPADLGGRAVHACSAIGNPEAFAGLLGDLGARVVGRSEFGDHAVLSEADWRDVLDAARREGAERVVVTRKDAVKYPTLPPEVAVLDVETEVVRGAEALWDRVLGAISPAGAGVTSR